MRIRIRKRTATTTMMMIFRVNKSNYVRVPNKVVLESSHCITHTVLVYDWEYNTQKTVVILKWNQANQYKNQSSRVSQYSQIESRHVICADATFTQVISSQLY